MRRTLFLALCAVALVAIDASTPRTTLGQVPFGPQGGDQAEGPRFPDFNSVVRGAKEYEGLFKLYQKDERVLMEIQPHQFNRPFLCPIAIARGAGMGGDTLNSDEQWVLFFRRVGDKVHLVRRNVHFKARPGSPAARAVEVTYTDSVLMALRILAINMMRNQGVLINLNDIFMTDFAGLGAGGFDPNRSVWNKVKTFPRNVELQVQATYAGGRRGHGEEVIDGRGNTIVIHYGLVDLPDSGYQPRLADDRVGYFLSAVKDYSSPNKDTAFVRYINRWRLERAEPGDATTLSVPKQSIKFYLEKTVPHEYRADVQAGILEWNKAFEKVGYRNAIEVVQMRDDEDFDPEDMNYNTFRWITSGRAFARGPSRANPLTGEILDADIVFDADLVRSWKKEQRVYNGGKTALAPVSPIQAMDRGWGLDQLALGRGADAGWNETPRRLAEDPIRAHLEAIQHGVCQCGNHLQFELGLAAMTLAAAPPRTGKETEELVHQAVKMVVMHEVGHTLGLRHNFKASTMLANDQLHDTKITREKGLVGSVMDYCPVNLAPKGVKQGDYFTTTLGPYDYWAIEYAYKPLNGGTEGEWGELQKIAKRGAELGHDYGTDEDTFLTADPLINRWDLGADVMRFAQDRMALADDLLKDLTTRVVTEGEGYQKARTALGIILSQYGNGAYLVGKYVGGEHVYRDHRGDPKARDPLVPVTPAKQREALKFLRDRILTDHPFEFQQEVLRKLAVERWMHWGADPDDADFPLFDRILGIQRVALGQALDAETLRRIQTNALKAGKDDQPLLIAEVFRTLTDGIWSDVGNGNGNGNGNGKEEKKTPGAQVIRRNLQREHLKRLAAMVLGSKDSGGLMIMGGRIVLASEDVPADARSLARSHLREINKKIETMLTDRQQAVDETTHAHLEECRERITKVLNASMQVND